MLKGLILPMFLYLDILFWQNFDFNSFVENFMF